MSFYKRTRPDVLASFAPGKKRTFLVQPMEGAVKHRPWGRFTVTEDWIRLGLKWHAFMALREDEPLDACLVSVPIHLRYSLNADNEDARQRIIKMPDCRVELRAPPPDGRIRFVGYSKDNRPLVHGMADPILLHDLLNIICPMSPHTWDTHKIESQLQGEVPEDNMEEV